MKTKVILFGLWITLLSGCASFPAVVIGTGQSGPGDGDYARAMAVRSSAVRQTKPITAHAGP